MTDTSPTASGSPARRGRVFQAGAARAPQPVLDEKLTAPAGYGSSAGPPTPEREPTAVGAPAPYTGQKGDLHAEVLVLGAGPGELLRRLPRRRPRPQGRHGRLPRPAGRGVSGTSAASPPKPSLHAAKVIAETKEMSHAGLAFASPTIDLNSPPPPSWKDGVEVDGGGGERQARRGSSLWFRQ